MASFDGGNEERYVNVQYCVQYSYMYIRLKRRKQNEIRTKILILIFSFYFTSYLTIASVVCIPIIGCRWMCFSISIFFCKMLILSISLSMCTFYFIKLDINGFLFEFCAAYDYFRLADFPILVLFLLFTFSNGWCVCVHSFLYLLFQY